MAVRVGLWCSLPVIAQLDLGAVASAYFAHQVDLSLIGTGEFLDLKLQPLWKKLLSVWLSDGDAACRGTG